METFERLAQAARANNQCLGCFGRNDNGSCYFCVSCYENWIGGGAIFSYFKNEAIRLTYFTERTHRACLVIAYDILLEINS